MSLIEPTYLAFWNKWKTYLVVGGLGLLLLGLALFLWSWGDGYFFSRDIDRTKANVNATLEEAKQVGSNINAEKATEKQVIANVEKATNEHLDAINATDATRQNVNAAIERMKQASNLNRNVNAAEVEEAMRGL